MLGVLHRAALGSGPEALRKYFQLDTSSRAGPITRSRHHSRALVYDRAGVDLEICRRSIIGLVAVYNLLPEEVVAANAVKSIQGRLQRMVVERALDGDEHWATMLSPRHDMYGHPLT